MFQQGKANRIEHEVRKSKNWSTPIPGNTESPQQSSPGISETGPGNFASPALQAGPNVPLYLDSTCEIKCNINKNNIMFQYKFKEKKIEKKKIRKIAQRHREK